MNGVREALGRYARPCAVILGAVALRIILWMLALIGIGRLVAPYTPIAETLALLGVTWLIAEVLQDVVDAWRRPGDGGDDTDA